MARQLTLKGIIIVLLKNIQLIVVFALILGLLLGGYQAFRNSRRPLDIVQDEQYIEALAIARQDVEKVQATMNDLREYIDNSIYFNMDSNHRGEYTLVFKVDLPSHAEDELTLEMSDKLQDVLAQYKRVFCNDDSIKKYLKEIFGAEIEESYIFELMEVVDIAPSVYRITVLHDDLELASTAAHYIFDESYQIIDKFEPHNAVVVAASGTFISDRPLADAQARAIANLGSYSINLQQREKALDELIAKAPTVMRGRPAALYGMAGVVLGGGIGFLIVLLYATMNNKINAIEDIASRYKLKILGAAPIQYKKKYWFQALLSKLERSVWESPTRMGSFGAAAANIMVMTEGTDILSLAGPVGDGLLGSVAAELSAALGRDIEASGNILADSAAIKMLEGADAVVMVVARGETTVECMDAVLYRLEALNKKILGVILV